MIFEVVMFSPWFFNCRTEKLNDRTPEAKISTLAATLAPVPLPDAQPAASYRTFVDLPKQALRFGPLINAEIIGS
jgi:hypothetical protein